MRRRTLLLEGSDLPREPQLSEPEVNRIGSRACGLPCPWLVEPWKAGSGVVLGLRVESWGPGRL